MEVKNLIIGGGLSGLSSAYFLQKQGENDYLVIEKDKTLGGYCRTIPNDKYVWDYAGHFYHFRTQKYKDFFMSLVDEKEIVYSSKNTKIYYNDKLINYPFQMNIHELDKDEFIDCLYDLFTKDTSAQYDNYLDMLYVKFGKAITEKFLRPYNEKLYATDLRSLDVDAMGRFFPYANVEDIIKNMKESQKKTYNDNFMYLKQGTGYFIDKLAEQLDANNILTNTEVVSINAERHTVTLSTGEKVHYQHLINTSPFNQLLASLSNNKYVNTVPQLSYNKVLVFNIGFNAPSPKYTKEHWIYFPDKTLNFYRVGFYNNILGEDNLNIYVEIGFPKDSGQVDVLMEFNKTIEGLKRVGIIDDKMSVVDYVSIMMDPAYVHISNERSNNQILQELESQQIYSLGRYGRWTYNSMEDCMSLADALAERLSNQ